MKKLLFIFILFFTTTSRGMTLEEKLIYLENKIRELEKRVETLEKATQPEMQTQKKPEPHKRETGYIDYKVVEKRFKKIEDRLVERDEKIQIVFEIRNNFPKQIDTIYGELIIKNKKGEEIIKKPVKIYKPLDFFSSGKIKPGETFRRVVELIYDEQLPNLRYLKDAPLSDLIVELIFTKVEFSDGSVEFL